MSISESTSLLEVTQRLIEIERSLTSVLERVEPWLSPNTTNPSTWNAYKKRVRPIPTSMEEVELVLAVARNYSSRSSAPAGWNPSAPVVGFSTPNPLPHQLRGGALAALELERARQEERSQKRKRQAEVEEEAEQAKARKAAAAAAAEVEEKKSSDTTNKEGTTNLDQTSTGRPTSAKKVQDPNHGAGRVRTSTNRPAPSQQQQQQTSENTTMNLSDSSSEEDDDSDDE